MTDKIRKIYDDEMDMKLTQFQQYKGFMPELFSDESMTGSLLKLAEEQHEQLESFRDELMELRRRDYRKAVEELTEKNEILSRQRLELEKYILRMDDAVNVIIDMIPEEGGLRDSIVELVEGYRANVE